MLQSSNTTRTRRFGGNTGFTLIELLVVIVILGILAGIVAFGVSGVSGKAESASCKTNEATIQSAAEAYFLDAGSYPIGAANAVNFDVLIPTYLKKEPASGTFTIDADGNVDGSCA